MKNKSINIDIEKIVREFNEHERDGKARKDAFKIEGNFADAVRKIAKAKPKKPSPRA